METAAQSDFLFLIVMYKFSYLLIHLPSLTRTTCFSILVMLVILVNCVFMATKEEIPNTE